MPYLVMVHATFDTKADADHIYDQAKSVAQNASVARLGSAGERTSHCGVFNEQPDGSLVKDRQWHIDRFGIVRETPPVPDDVIPSWVPPEGAQSAYPATDVYGNPAQVQHNGATWQQNISSGGLAYNEPGVFGWVQV